VAADLRQDSVVAALTTAGDDHRTATHFMTEGLTSYLPSRLLRDVLGSLASVAAPQSTLAIDFLEPPNHRSAASRLLLALVRTSTAMMGERIVTLVTPRDAASLLRDTGWHDAELSRPAISVPVVFATASIQ
jgi:O-methyltransferase involved in polyketide biosynthesis